MLVACVFFFFLPSSITVLGGPCQCEARLREGFGGGEVLGKGRSSMRTGLTITDSTAERAMVEKDLSEMEGLRGEGFHKNGASS